MTLSENGLRDPATLMSRVAYDANGNAMALWTNSFNDATYTIQSAVRPVRQDWSEPVTLVNNSYTYGADLGVSALGDALALFMYGIGSALQIQSKESDISGFNNNVWSAPITLYSSAENGFPHVATTLTGNTLNAATVWLTNNGSINQVVASTGTRSIVLPPSSPTVSQSTNNFGVFTEYANTLSWTASTDPSVVGYLIYRNGEFLGQVSASTVQYVDHNRVQNGSVTYGVSAVNVQNSHSKIVNVNFP